MIQQTLNPPFAEHLSPFRPIDWATRPTYQQAKRELLKATINAVGVLVKLEFVAKIAKHKFARGGMIRSSSMRRFTRGVDGGLIDVTRMDGS